MALQHPWTLPLAEIWDKWHRCSKVQKIYFFSIILIFFLWRVHSSALTANRRTGNVSALRGLRARQGQSPEMADWGTSGKDGGEICRLQLLPPQPNVPWETGLHTQQCCGTGNKRGCAGWGEGSTSPPPSSVSLAGATSSVIHFIWSQPESLWTHCTVFTNTGHSVLLAGLLFAVVCEQVPVGASSPLRLNLGRLLLEGWLCVVPGAHWAQLSSAVTEAPSARVSVSPHSAFVAPPFFLLIIPSSSSLSLISAPFPLFNFSLSSNSFWSCCGCSCARLSLVVQGGIGPVSRL